MFNKKNEHIFDFTEIKEVTETPEESTKVKNDVELEDFSDDINISKKDDENTDNLIKDEEVSKENIKTSESTEEIKTLDQFEVEKPSEESKDEFESTISKSNIQKERFKKELAEFLLKVKSGYSSLEAYLDKKGFKIDKKLISLHINESLRTIILLLLSFFALSQAYSTYEAQDKLNLIKKYYQIKKDIKIEDEKIKENIKAEYLADILKFGVKTESGRYPELGYLHALNEVFPDNIGELQLLTFLEGWSSEFKDYKGRTIRVDNGLIKTFKQDNDITDNGLLKGYKYKLVLEGEPDKVDNFLYNIRYSNKIPKYFEKINKKYNSNKGLLTVEMDVLFYLSK